MVTAPKAAGNRRVPTVRSVIVLRRGMRLDKERCMRKRNVFTALAAAAMMLQLVGGTGISGAQVTPDVAFSFSPTSGTAGTKIVFAGTGCPHVAPTPQRDFDGIVFLTQGSANPVPGTSVNFVSDADGKFTPQIDTTGLAPGQYTTFAVCATTSKGGPGSPFTVTVPVVPGSTYFPLVPGRVLDTRTGAGVGGAINPIGTGG